MRHDPYASRVGRRWEAVERLDPVVWGDAAEPVCSEEIELFRDRGFLFVPNLLSADETEEFFEEALRLARDATLDEDDPEVILEPESTVVRTVFRAHRRSRAFRDLAKDPRLADVARQILASEVYVHQSRINYKPALDGREFGWHSDFETWHVEDGMPQPRALSASVFLTETTEFNGPLMVIPGSHRSFVRCVGKTPERHYETSLRKQEYGTPAPEALRTLALRGGIETPKGPAGSVLFFDSNLMHASTGNLSPFPRTSLFLVLNSVENTLLDPFGGIAPRPEFLGERDFVPVSRP